MLCSRKVLIIFLTLLLLNSIDHPIHADIRGLAVTFISEPVRYAGASFLFLGIGGGLACIQSALGLENVAPYTTGQLGLFALRYLALGTITVACGLTLENLLKLK